MKYRDSLYSEYLFGNRFTSKQEIIKNIARFLFCDLATISKLNIKDLMAAQYIIEQIGAINRDGVHLISGIKHIIVNSIIEGSSKRKTAEALRIRLGGYNHDWLKIANTKLQVANDAGKVAEIATNTPEGEPVLLKRWEMYDPAVCNICKRFNKKIAMLVEGERESDIAPKDSPADYLIWPSKNNCNRKRSEWQLSFGPIHPNCRGSWDLYTKIEQENKDLFASWEKTKKLKTKLWQQAEKQANAPVTMPDGTTRRGKGNVGTVYSQLLQQAKKEGKL